MLTIKRDSSGFDRLQRNIKKLSDTKRIPLPELMPDGFMQSNTKYSTLQAFFDASGIKGEEEIGSGEFDKFVATNSRFDNWSEMFRTAGETWAKRQLTL